MSFLKTLTGQPTIRGRTATKKKKRGRKKSPKRKKKKVVKKKKKKKKRKKGKKKDPNAPKRAQSAYFLFMGDVREKVKAQYPEFNIGQIAQHIGGLWRELSNSKKAPYERQAKKLKEQYHVDRANYLEAKYDPNKPKRPQSSYFLFMGSVRSSVKAENPHYTIGEIAKHIGAMWKQLSARERAPFEKEAAKLKEQYLRDIAAYNES
jgi:uncharacterized protein (DUF736 family)